MSETASNLGNAQVLIVEDDAGLARLINKHLSKQGCTCEMVATGQETRQLLAEFTPTFMLLDFSLPDTTAEELVADLKGRGIMPPFIVISGREHTATAVSMMKLGARDYLIKDHDFFAHLLPVAVRVMHELDTEERLRTAEAALRESEERLRSTIASLDDLIFVLDKEGRFIDFYQPAPNSRLFSARDHFLGRAYWEIGLPAETVKLLAKAIAGVKESGEVQSFDYHLDEAGGVRWFSAKVSMRRDGGGNFDGITIVSRDITERKTFEEKLFYLSSHDTLTGLYNRAYFETELDRLAKSRHFPVSVVVADLDELKKTNDSRGHAAGDNLLKLAANALIEAFRAEDVVARVGGDEFAVLLPGTDATAADKIVKRAREGINNAKTAHKVPSLRLSFGWATAGSGGELLATLKKADKSMYQDKKENRRV